MWIIPWNSFLIKKLLKNEVYKSRKQCIDPIMRTITWSIATDAHCWWKNSQQLRLKKKNEEDEEGKCTNKKTQTRKRGFKRTKYTFFFSCFYIKSNVFRTFHQIWLRLTLRNLIESRPESRPSYQDKPKLILKNNNFPSKF